MSANKFIVRDTDRGTERPVESRSKAEEVADDLRGIVKQSGGNPECIEIVPPNSTDGGTEVVDESPTDNDEPRETQTEAIPEPSTLTSDSLEVISKNAVIDTSALTSPVLSVSPARPTVPRVAVPITILLRVAVCGTGIPTKPTEGRHLNPRHAV